MSCKVAYKVKRFNPYTMGRPIGRRQRVIIGIKHPRYCNFAMEHDQEVGIALSDYDNINYTLSASWWLINVILFMVC